MGWGGDEAEVRLRRARELGAKGVLRYRDVNRPC